MGAHPATPTPATLPHIQPLTYQPAPHSQYLQDATDKLINEDLNGEELQTSEELQIPVYHTKDGMSNSWLRYSLTQLPFQALTSENVMAPSR